MNIIRRIKQTLSRLSSLTEDSDQVLFDLDTFEITKRELIMGVIIFCGMMLIGVGITNGIVDYEENLKRQYTQALHVETKDMFEYGMMTNVGNALCYGTLAAVDTVGFEEIPGNYLYAKKVREEYTRHEKQVEHKDEDGKTYYTTETYYSWDYSGSWDKHSNYITFLGVKFEYAKITRPIDHYIDTIYEDSDTRYVYHGTDPEHTGTIYARLWDNTIPDHTTFYENMTIDEVTDYLCSSYGVLIFWIIWVIVTAVVLYAFFYLNNNWLD